MRGGIVAVGAILLFIGIVGYMYLTSSIQQYEEHYIPFLMEPTPDEAFMYQSCFLGLFAVGIVIAIAGLIATKKH